MTVKVPNIASSIADVIVIRLLSLTLALPRVGSTTRADGVGPGVAVVEGLDPSAVSDSVGVASSKKHAVADVTNRAVTLVQPVKEDPIFSPLKIFRNHLRRCRNIFVVWLATVQKSSRTTSIEGITQNIGNTICMRKAVTNYSIT